METNLIGFSEVNMSGDVTAFSGSSGAGIPLGGVVVLPEMFPVKAVVDGMTFLRSGFYETEDYSPLLADSFKANLIPVPIEGNLGLTSASNMLIANDGAGNFMVLGDITNTGFSVRHSSDFFENYTAGSYTHSSNSSSLYGFHSGGPNSNIWYFSKGSDRYYTLNNGETWQSGALTGANTMAISPITGTQVSFNTNSVSLKRAVAGSVTFNGCTWSPSSGFSSTYGVFVTSDGTFLIGGKPSSATVEVHISTDDGVSFSGPYVIKSASGNANICFAELSAGELIATGHDNRGIPFRTFDKFATFADYPMGRLGQNLGYGLFNLRDGVPGKMVFNGKFLSVDGGNTVNQIGAAVTKGGIDHDTLKGFVVTGSTAWAAGPTSSIKYQLNKLVPAAGIPDLPVTAYLAETSGVISRFGINYLRIK